MGEFLGGWGAGLVFSDPVAEGPVPVLVVDFAASLFNPGVSLRASRTNGKKVIPPDDCEEKRKMKKEKRIEKKRAVCMGMFCV